MWLRSRGVLLFLVLLVSADAAAQVVGTGVTFLDPLNYTKPAYRPVYGPNEGTTAAKYYLNFATGAGTACTAAAPCRQLRNLVGKPGMNGGPAIVYVMGSGSAAFHLYGTAGFGGTGDQDCLVAGNCASWILIRPWPAGVGSCQTEMCAATISGTNSWRGVNVHHTIIDGGPQLKINFVGTVTGAFEYVWQVNSPYITVARTFSRCNSTSATARLWAIGNGGVARHFTAVNNEFADCVNDDGSSTSAQISSAYFGPSDGGGWQNARFLSNVVRNMPGEGVEFNTRAASAVLLVEGNAIHHVGRGTCSHAQWNCRPALTFDTNSGQPSTGIVVRNNLMWMLGSACAYARVPGIQFDYNTCLNWAQDNHQPGGIDNPTALETGNGVTGRGNILVSMNGANPLDSGSYNLTGNLCNPGETCGASKTDYNAGVFLSLDQNHPNFLKLGPASVAADIGPVITGFTRDYLGGTRPQGAGLDLGAFERSGEDVNQDCEFTWGEWITASLGACTNGQQTVTQRRDPIITKPALGIGKACPVFQNQSFQQSCTLPVAAPPGVSRACTFFLSAAPPDNTGTWTAIFKRQGIVVTSPDTVPEGNYAYSVEWTKQGVGVVISAATEKVCQ